MGRKEPERVTARGASGCTDAARDEGGGRGGEKEEAAETDKAEESEA
jgi:hypothetical protein